MPDQSKKKTKTWNNRLGQMVTAVLGMDVLVPSILDKTEIDKVPSAVKKWMKLFYEVTEKDGNDHFYTSRSTDFRVC